MKRSLVPIALSLAFLAGVCLLFLPDFSRPPIIKFLIMSQVLFVLSVSIWWGSRSLDFSGKHRRIFWSLLIVAILARGLMLIGPGDTFYLSDDVYRYVWDGKQTANGINPYLYPPSDPAVEHLADSVIFPKINHPHLPTIYPPMAQNVFLVSYLLGGDSTFVFKLISAFFELLTIVALLVLMRLWQVSRVHLLLYLFSPLVLIEFYLSAHLDILAMPFLVLALVSLVRRRPVLVGVFLGLAAMVKFNGLFFAPVLFFHFEGRDKLRFALSLALTVVACYFPYTIDSHGEFLGSLGAYLGDWQFNGSIYFLFKSLLGSSAARLVSAGIFVVWIGFVISRRMPVERKLFDSYAGYLVLTPTFFPWYFVWLMPLLITHRSPAFLWLSGAVLLSYHVLIGQYSTGTWSPMIWLGMVAYVPFYVLLIWTTLKPDNRLSRSLAR